MHPTVAVHLFRSTWLLARFGASMKHLVWLLRNVRRYEFVHIHTIFFLGALYTSLICSVRRVPYFVWPHGTLDGYDLQKHRVAKAVTGRLVFSLALRGATSLFMHDYPRST